MQTEPLETPRQTQVLSWARRLLLSLLLAAPPALAADWGPAVGAAMPALAANDQTGAAQTLATLSGDQGLLLFLVRSADW